MSGFTGCEHGLNYLKSLGPTDLLKLTVDSPEIEILEDGRIALVGGNVLDIIIRHNYAVKAD